MKLIQKKPFPPTTTRSRSCKFYSKYSNIQLVLEVLYSTRLKKLGLKLIIKLHQKYFKALNLLAASTLLSFS